MKKSFLIGIAIFLSISVYATESITILTGGTSGVYYPIGIALSSIYTKEIHDSKIAVIATKGSIENLNMLESEHGEVAISLGDSLSNAYRGNEEAGFPIPLTKLRTIGALYPNYIHFIATSDSGITSLADMKGKRVSVGALKSGSERNARVILNAAGLSYKDFAKVEYLSYAESVKLMKNRQLDVILLSAGADIFVLHDLAKSQKIVFLNIPEEIVKKIDNPAYQVGIIPAQTYEGQTNDVHTIAVQNFLVTHSELSDETVYLMTRAMFENLDQMVSAHTAAKAINLDNAVKNLPVPLHPGAAQYYKEMEIILP